MSFKTYPKLHHIGKEETKEIFQNPEDIIHIEEKIDGANFRFMIDGDRIIFGSRTQSIGDSTNEIGGNWKRCSEYVKMQTQGKNLSILNGMIVFGECCVAHTLPYDWAKIPPFLGFDVMEIKSDKFLSYDDKKAIFDYLDLPMVPLVAVMQASEIKSITDELVPIAKYVSPSTQDRQAEGIVFKNYSKGFYAKYVRDKFKEANALTFGGSAKHAEDDSNWIALKYATNPRIEKAIFKLLQEGHKLDMPLMALIPNMIYTDIWEENWREIVFMDLKNVNFRDARKAITKRCLNVLKQMITNNALNPIEVS